MIACIILHNMIVEDEFVEEDFVEPNEFVEAANVYDHLVGAYG